MTSFSEGQLLQLDTMLHLLDERTSLDTDLEQAWLQLRSSLEQNNTPFSQIASAHLSDQELVGFWSTLLDTAPELVNPQHLSDAIAEDMVTHLKDKVDAYRFTDPQQSATFAQQIITIANIRDDLSQLGLGYMAYGDSLQRMGRIWDAWEQLQKAEQYFEQAGDEIGWARLRISLLGLSIQLDGEYSEKLLADVERAEEIFIQHNMEDKLLRIKLNAGAVISRLGRHQEALRIFSSAVEFANSVPQYDEWMLSALYQNISINHLWLGNMNDALHYNEQAYEQYLRNKHWDGVASSQLNIVVIALAQGRYAYALKTIHKTLNTPEITDPRHKLIAKQHLVECYLALNRYDDALILAKQIGQEFDTLGYNIEYAKNFVHSTIIYAHYSMWDDAHDTIQQAISIFSELGAELLVAFSSLQLAKIALMQSDLFTAQHNVSVAYQYFEKENSQINFARATLIQTRINSLHNSGIPITSDISTVIRIAQQEQIPSLEYDAQILWGEILEQRGDIPSARKHYHLATNIVDNWQQNLTITLRRDFLQQDYLEGYGALIRLGLRDMNPQSVFETLERLKSQVFLSYVTNRDQLRWTQDEQAQEFIQQLENLRAQYHWVANDEQQSNKAEKLTHIRQQIQQITEQLYLNAANIDGTHTALPPTLEAVQGYLAENETLIEFYLDKEYIWCCVVHHNNIFLQQLGEVQLLQTYLRQLDVNIKAAMLHEPLSSVSIAFMQQLRQLSKHIFQALFAPIQQFLMDCERLIIVPFGMLHTLPFPILINHDERYLVESHEIQIVPSASVLLRSYVDVDVPGAIAIGHSWDDYILGRTQEAEMVHEYFGGSLYLEEQAIHHVLEAPAHQILHIAAHGEFFLDHPDLSYILLADGRLYTDDLLQHDLHYELVTLSACETGRNRLVPSDELIGLGRGFLYAGARSIIASLWQVEDQWTVELMQHLYRALHTGSPKATALANAQRKIIQSQPQLHPFFWGAFQLIGDADPLSVKGG